MDPTGNMAGERERSLSTRTSVTSSVNDVDRNEEHEYASAGMVADGFRPSRPEEHDLASAGTVAGGNRSLPFDEQIRALTSMVADRFPSPPAEHEFASAGMVADGFRLSPSEGSSVPSTPSLTSGSSAPLRDESPDSLRTICSLSPQVPRTPRASLSSALELPGLTRHETSSTTTVVSSVYIPPADSPYRGPTGASHPYDMYQQNVRSARTMSLTTLSTMPSSESAYTGPRGPSHPYALYPQIEGIEVDAVQDAAIPLGFPYQRRLGPDGDDVGDIIGPNGHTEQLPPYTRYPDAAYIAKTLSLTLDPPPVQGATIIPADLRVPSPTVSPIPGAGGLGLATRDPEFESTDDLDSPRSRTSAQSFTSENTRLRINADDENMDEKGKPLKKWQVWMKRKVCGVVPIWSLFLTGVVILVMTGLGAGIGTEMNKQKNAHKSGARGGPFDAEPIPTPTDLSPLPVGTYGIPLMGTSNRVSSTCFQDSALSKAWDCHPVVFDLHLTVSKTGDDYSATLDCNRSFTISSHVYSYGEQPPLIIEPVGLQLVRDKFEPSRGPAWFKMLTYNKTVILPESWHSSSSSTSGSRRKRRGMPSMGPGISNFKRKGIAQKGEKPWVCNWPNTYLELFIYAQQNSSYSNRAKPQPTSSSSTTSMSLTTPPPNASPTPPDGSYQSFPGGSYPPGGGSNGNNNGGGGFGAEPVDSQSTRYNSNKGYYPQELAYQQQPDDGNRSPPEHSPTDSASPTDSPSPTTSTTTAFDPIDTGDDHAPPPPAYPRVVKLEERRVSMAADAARPRCTQVEIQGAGQEATVVRDKDGEAVVVEIEEIEMFGGGGPPPDASGADGVERRDWEEEEREGEGGWDEVGRALVLPRDGVPDISPCGCMWYLT